VGIEGFEIPKICASSNGLSNNTSSTSRNKSASTSHRKELQILMQTQDQASHQLPTHKMGSWSPLIFGILALATLNTTAAEVTSRNI
jgi:hypothetical protein